MGAYKHIIYRGVSDCSFKLLSSIGRRGHPIDKLEQIERSMLEEYKKTIDIQQALKFKLENINEDLFFLSNARHMGLDCRLLDWTVSRDVATQFAICDENNLDKTAAIWVLEIPSDYLDRHQYKYNTMNPFQNEDVLRIIKMDFYGDSFRDSPEAVKRRLMQNSIFTLTKTELVNTPLEDIDLGDIKLFVAEYLNPKMKQNYIKKHASFIEKHKLPPVTQKVIDINQKYAKQS